MFTFSLGDGKGKYKVGWSLLFRFVHQALCYNKDKKKKCNYQIKYQVFYFLFEILFVYLLYV